MDQNGVLIEDLPIVTPGKIGYNPYKYKGKPDLKKSASRIKKKKKKKLKAETKRKTKTYKLKSCLMAKKGGFLRNRRFNDN